MRRLKDLFDSLLERAARAPMRGRTGGAPKGYRTINRLNRSRKWPRARDYSHARALSPFPERPVR